MEAITIYIKAFVPSYTPSWHHSLSETLPGRRRRCINHHFCKIRHHLVEGPHLCHCQPKRFPTHSEPLLTTSPHQLPDSLEAGLEMVCKGIEGCGPYWITCWGTGG
ncbi:hypothetical protein CK203_093463 [Vitis vinifera]|uniref:Uncharacterized protein n=1 Tax=Vitis vinifera TaxID=29760 RepID=A0A438BNE2_VITVI|nr:hypothetical protein CK203_093463 [Vitis vinifera]